MAGGFKRIEDYDVIDPVDLPDDAVVYTVLPSESTPALIDRNWTWAGFKAWLTTFTEIVANALHRGSDGKNHSDVVLNTIHRGLTSNPHSVTKDQVGLGVTASPTFNIIVCQSIGYIFATGTNGINVATSTANTSSQSYTKLLEVISPGKGTIEVRFGLENSLTFGCNGKIYVNGIAVGTERFNDNQTPVFFTETISVEYGDLVQIYGKTIGAAAVVTNLLMRVSGNTPNYIRAILAAYITVEAF